MKHALWKPIRTDGTVDKAELARPAVIAEPVMWETTLFADSPPHRFWMHHAAAVFGAAALAPKHAFRFTLADTARAKEWFRVAGQYAHREQWCANEACAVLPVSVTVGIRQRFQNVWPLPNVTLVSPVIRTQAEADQVLPVLIVLPAPRCEAVLAPTEAIDVSDYIDRGYESGGPQGWIDLPSVGGVRVRGGATPMHPAWLRKLRDQAKAVGADFSLAWGEWTVRHPGLSDDEPRIRLGENGGNAHFLENSGGEEVWMQRVGAARSGCTLDGVDYPESSR